MGSDMKAEMTQKLIDQKSIDFSTKTMFKGRKTLVIEHRGEEYCLRLTRNDKLILTK